MALTTQHVTVPLEPNVDVRLPGCSDVTQVILGNVTYASGRYTSSRKWEATFAPCDDPRYSLIDVCMYGTTKVLASIILHRPSGTYCLSVFPLLGDRRLQLTLTITFDTKETPCNDA